MNYGKARNLNDVSDVQVTGISTGVAPFKRMTNTLPSTRDCSTDLLVKSCTSAFPECHTNLQPSAGLHAFL